MTRTLSGKEHLRTLPRRRQLVYALGKALESLGYRLVIWAWRS